MTASPLYVTGVTPEGQPLVGGVYRMKDEFGFPIDLSVLVLREKGANVDWLELLADAGRQSDASKLLDAVAELEAQAQIDVAHIKASFAAIISVTAGASTADKCAAIYRAKKHPKRD